MLYLKLMLDYYRKLNVYHIIFNNNSNNKN